MNMEWPISEIDAGTVILVEPYRDMTISQRWLRLTHALFVFLQSVMLHLSVTNAHPVFTRLAVSSLFPEPLCATYIDVGRWIINSLVVSFDIVSWGMRNDPDPLRYLDKSLGKVNSLSSETSAYSEALDKGKFTPSCFGSRE